MSPTRTPPSLPPPPRGEPPPAPQLTIAACAPGMRETSIKVRREACTRRVAKCENGVGASRPLHAAGRPSSFIAIVVGVVCGMCWRAERRGRGVLWRARVGYRCRNIAGRTGCEHVCDRAFPSARRASSCIILLAVRRALLLLLPLLLLLLRPLVRVLCLLCGRLWCPSAIGILHNMRVLCQGVFCRMRL